MEQNERHLLRQDDIYIAVLGMTGTGKSTFVARCADKPLPHTDHELDSDTTAIVVETFERNGCTVHLIDTPGFDDTVRDDATILQEFAFWLLQAHRIGFKLSGLIYVHRITDSRLQGSGLRSLKVFKAMCGAHCYQNVVMATTRWDEVVGSLGADHKAELVDTAAFWGDIVAGGGRVMPLHWNRASALAVIDYILSNPQRLTLNIQLELASGGTPLHETAAGKIVYKEHRRVMRQWDKQVKDLEIEWATAVREHHDRNRIECRSEIEDLRSQIRAKTAALQAFRVTGDEILSTWTRKIAQEMGALTSQARNTQKLQRLEESRLQLAEDSEQWRYDDSLAWSRPDRSAIVLVREQGRLSSHCFDPQEVSAVTGVMSMFIGLGSLVVAASPLLCTIM